MLPSVTNENCTSPELDPAATLSLARYLRFHASSGPLMSMPMNWYKTQYQCVTSLPDPVFGSRNAFAPQISVPCGSSTNSTTATPSGDSVGGTKLVMSALVLTDLSADTNSVSPAPAKRQPPLSKMVNRFVSVMSLVAALNSSAVSLMSDAVMVTVDTIGRALCGVASTYSASFSLPSYPTLMLSRPSPAPPNQGGTQG